MASIVTERMPAFPARCVRYECGAYPEEISWQASGVLNWVTPVDYWFCERCFVNWGTVH